MKKIILIILLSCVAFVLAFLLTKEDTTPKRALIKELNALACDLNTQDCSFDFKGKKVLVKTNLKPILALEEFKLIVENLGKYEKLNARIYGLNMYMGDMIPSFEATSLNSYEANVVLSACVLDIMRFRVEFFDGNEPIGFYFDFDLKR